MNKIRCLAITLAMLLSCSNEDKFSEANHFRIWLDGISAGISRDTLRLDEELYIENNDIWQIIYLRQLGEYGYLQNFFWIIDADTIYDYRARKKISYGWHFFELLFVDAWSDTMSYRDSIFYKEPLSITLLSPVDNYCPQNNKAEFQYKINGEDKEKAQVELLYNCENCDRKGNYLEFDGAVRWRVKAYTEQDSVFSEVRVICPEN